MVYSLSQGGSWALRIQFRRNDSLNFRRRFNAADTHVNIRSNHRHRGRPSPYRLRSRVSNRQPRQLRRAEIGEGYRHIHDLRVAPAMRIVWGGSCVTLFCGPKLGIPSTFGRLRVFYSDHLYLKAPMISGAQRRITLDCCACRRPAPADTVSGVVWNCPHTPAE